MSATSKYIVGTVKNVVTGKTIEICVKTYGEGYIRPGGAMKEITATARREILARATEAVEVKQNLFSKEIMEKTHRFYLTNPAEHSSDHKDPHWDIDACDENYGKIRNAHLTKDSNARTMAK